MQIYRVQGTGGRAGGLRGHPFVPLTLFGPGDNFGARTSPPPLSHDGLVGLGEFASAAYFPLQPCEHTARQLMPHALYYSKMRAHLVPS